MPSIRRFRIEKKKKKTKPLGGKSNNGGPGDPGSLAFTLVGCFEGWGEIKGSRHLPADKARDIEKYLVAFAVIPFLSAMRVKVVSVRCAL
jgi:hypothetical protein